MWTKEGEAYRQLQTGEIVTYDPWKPLLEELTFTIRLLSNPSLFI